ncbi:MAG: hypothetical protein B6A08_05455 [Sorangiineae bacterium NIC37A_2]|jgi:hypothetical protein|nr:MAG: hypothetical protein B6A08_05455 [Sorangiineae bacterium NIC37A_2]
MIEVLPDFPSDVLAFRLKGTLTREDYENVLMPKVRRAFDDGSEVRVYLEVGHDFVGQEKGAIWEDLKMGFEYGLSHRDQWKKIAVVTDLEWLARAIVLFGWLAPGEILLFTFEHQLKAKSWVCG